MIGGVQRDVQIGSSADDIGYGLDRRGDGACENEAQHGTGRNDDQAGGDAGGDGALPHFFQRIQNNILIHQETENPVI